MIAPLRRRHRFMFLALAVLGLPLLFLSLSNRPSFPGDGLPAELAAPSTEPDGEPLATHHPFGRLDAELRIYPRVWVLEVRDPLRHPDVLAYWSSAPAETNLPADARWLGTVSTTKPSLFKSVPDQDGFLTLYSLGHQQIISSAPVDLPEVLIAPTLVAPVSGEPISGAPDSGEPASDAPVSGDPASGAPVSGDPASVAPGGAA